MKNLLRIDTSIFGINGQSGQLADDLVSRLRQEHPEMQVTTRDLGRSPVPHLDEATFTAFTTPADQRAPAQQAAVDFSDQLIAELREADVVVLGLPMYNFGVPPSLKAYFDHVARAGETFRYTPDGPVGLLEDRKVYVVAARGGRYEGTDLDTQTAFVRNFLAFVGLKDVEFIYAEGLAMGEDARNAGLGVARARIEAVAA